MARSLSNMVLKGFRSNYLFESKVASGSVFQKGMMYSIKISGDSETHEDFLPTNRHEYSAISAQDVVKQDVTENPVMIYMKGLPDAPRCGFSALAVKVLQQYGVPIGARNILENPELKEGIKAFSKWPTFPQIFVKGEFVGGSDIILDMHKNGELEELLTDVKKENSNV